MSNDVHLNRNKVSKIQRPNVDASKSNDMVHSRHYIERNIKGVPDPHPEARHADDTDYAFGSISPRGINGGACFVQQQGDVDSPDHTQRDTNESDNNISSCSTLDIVNKVENLSVQQLENQVRELSQRLKQAEDQRIDVQRKLEECQNEKELCFRRLEVVSAAHECRITEMHCVIAELSKKLRAKQENIIVEEQELEGSEISFQDGSVYNSEMNMTNPDAECQTDPLDGGDFSNADGFGNTVDNFFMESGEDPKLNETITKSKMEALQEEVLHLKAQIALLQSEIANSGRSNPNLNEDVVEEKQSIEYYEADAEANDSNCSVEQRQRHMENDKKELNDLNVVADFTAPLKQCTVLNSPQKASLVPVPKMAERVRLHCASKMDTSILYSEIKETNIIESLLDSVENENCTQQRFIKPTESDVELQRLYRRIEQLKMNNTVLALTLNECKEHCEHLYLLCGKYESNAIALQTAVNCSDRAIEAYDVMLALLESKLGILNDNSAASEDSRKAVESVARHLLDRLESEKDTYENSLGPWQNTFSIPDKACTPWTVEDDNRLRYHVSKLKGRRSTVQNTIVTLESPFSDFYEKSRLAIEHGIDIQKSENCSSLDLEMAVVMQELLSLREDNLSLRQKIKESEKSQLQAIEKIRSLQEALKPLQLQLDNDNDSSVLFHNNDSKNRISYSEAEHIALTEQQLVEALSRESELKGRIQTLISTVSASQKITDEKYTQLHNNIKELQKSNMSLSQIMEQNKRKYQTRIRKLEQKLSELNLHEEQHNEDNHMEQVHQFQRLKYKIAMNKPLTHDDVPETTL